MTRENYRVRKFDRYVGLDEELKDTTPAERLAMVWPLTVDVWAFMGYDIAESRLSRHIVRVLRRKG